jgi:orotate phosphoribosyltransferase
VRDLCRRPLDAFVVRKAAKDHGTAAAIEGPIEAGMPVVVVDDVVTTGDSTLQAIAACRAAALVIVAVIALVDRMEDDGLRRITAAAGAPVHAIFTRDELHACWLATNRG